MGGTSSSPQANVLDAFDVLDYEYRTIAGGRVGTVAPHPDGRHVFLGSVGDDGVTLVDWPRSAGRRAASGDDAKNGDVDAALERTRLADHKAPGLALTADGRTLFCTLGEDNGVAYTDALEWIAGRESAFVVGAEGVLSGHGAALSDDEQTLYVGTAYHHTVAAVDVTPIGCGGDDGKVLGEVRTVAGTDYCSFADGT